MIRWALDKWWGLAVALALIAWLAGGLVVRQIATNGGNALGQGIGGSFTAVGAIGDGYSEYSAIDEQIKAEEAEKRAKAAEERAKRAEKKLRGR